MRFALVLVIVACGSKREPPSDRTPPKPAHDASVATGGAEVRVDRRVELISIVQRMAGAPEYNKPSSAAYLRDVNQTFGRWASHPVILATRKLAAEHGINHDAPIELAIHLDDQLQPRAADELATLDQRWAGVDVAAYAAELRDFAAQSKFDAFFAAHAAHYAAVTDKLRTMVDAEHPVAWFDALFGPRTHARFVVVPGLVTNTWNFGVRANLPDALEMWQVLGIAADDGMPATDADAIALLVHEMAHSYINPIFESHAAELAVSGAKLFALVEQPMRAQAYGTWQTMLNEAGVRAVVVLYMRDKHGDVAGANAARAELRHSFVWINELVEVFRRYQRDKRPGLDAYMPAIVAFFDQLAVQYKDGLPKMPFLGPVDAAITNAPVFVAPSDPTLAAYVGQIRELLHAPSLIPASTHVFADTAGKHLVAYGSPATNPLVGTLIQKAQWKLTDDTITLGTRTFRGPGLVLVACWYRPDDSTHGVVVYAAAHDQDLVGINHGLHHGPSDWLVARRTAKGYEILATGDFPHAADGAWLLP